MRSKTSKKLVTFTLAACCGPLAAGMAWAQTAATNKAPAGRSMSAGGDMRASDILDKEIRNAQGEKIGEVDNLVIDIDNGHVRYAVVELDDAIADGDKKLAFPVTSFSMDRDQRLILNVSRNELEKAPGFKENKAPNFSDETYRSVIDRYFFKEEIARYTPSGARLVEAEDLIGKDVNDRAAHDAGDIKDIVVNFGNGRSYALMEVDKAWSPESKLVALPFAVFTVPDRPDLDLALNLDRPRIESAKGLEIDKSTDLNKDSVQRVVADQLAAFRSSSAPNPDATRTGRETASGSSQ
jgi:sporulation protein YlmC with PRC-barrel domain